jgi:hypothetical protein
MTDAIDLTGFKPATLPRGARPEMMWVRLADCVIDRRYQRPLTGKGRSAIQRMANGWSWMRFQPIVVAPLDDGRLAIVDGQHRAHAAALCGLSTLPAMVVQMGFEDQARGFAAMNRDRITLQPLQLFHADLAVGDVNAVAVRDAVEAAGCRIATSLPSAAFRVPGTVYALSVIRRMVRQSEAPAVTIGLSAIRRSEAGALPGAYDGNLLAIWLPALARDQRFLRLDLASVFDGICFDTLRDAARREWHRTGRAARQIAIDMVLARLREELRRAAA